MDAINQLVADVEEAEKRCRENDSQFDRRTLVRSLFALIEMVFFNLRTTTLECLTAEASFTGKLNVHHYSLLLEECPSLGEGGKVNFQQQRQPFVGHLAFTIRTLAEFLRLDPALWLGDNGWNELQKSVKIRHRLTHPKSLEDINVTDDDIQSIQRADRWMQDVNRGLIEAVAKLRKTGLRYRFGERIDQE